jgi:regulator of sirC expression with transglutaminase-like and TPR domain
MRIPQGLKFADIAVLDDEAIDLPAAALVIAADEYSGLDVQHYLDELDRIADRACRARSGLSDISEILQSINSVLFLEYGYQGNRQNYYDPRNSYLNQVIDRRTGIPITLSIIYMAVTDRVGLRISGVGMPGHFLVKYARTDGTTAPTGEIYIDPFNAGRLIDTAGCARLVEETSGGNLELRPEHLAAVSKKQILMRVLTNLLGIYSQAKDFARALRALDLILMIEPDEPARIRDRGLLLAAGGRERESIESLERYIKLSPGATDAHQILDSIKKVKARLSTLN